MNKINSTEYQKNANLACQSTAVCYIVIWQDRHSDTTAHPFTDKGKAISEARRIAKKYCRYPEDYKEKEFAGWLFYAQYSCESDHVRVVETVMDNAI